jgi:ligand-binding sensor domain-containing protein
MKIILGMLLLLLASLVPLPFLVGRGKPTVPDPPTDTCFASYREVTRLTYAPDGSVWAATTGGLLHRVRGNDTWEIAGSPATMPAAASLWRGKKIALTPGGGLRVDNTALPFPRDSRGTHFTAVGVDGDELVTALWGDAALYHSRRPGAWTREDIALTEDAGKQITSLAVGPNGALWIGTRRAGLWERPVAGAKWHAVSLSRSGPFAHDAQAMTWFQGDLYISTLEDGLVVRRADGWQHIARGDLSGDAPRQMVVFQNALYVRQGDGKVDRFDGSVWIRNVWAGQLPRKQISALATDGHLLYAAQWGGWSVWDGFRWKHHLQVDELQGLPITTLLPEGETLWIGTQGRGLAEADRTTGVIRRWHDERHGMPDDWITTLARCGDRLYAGTFVGGLVCLSRGAPTWNPVSGTAGENITDLLALPDNALYAATRHGVRYFIASNASIASCAAPPLVAGGTIEAQTLCSGPSGGLWVGTRTGLYFVKQ